MTSEPLRPATSFGAMHLLSNASMLRESKTFFHGDRITYAVVSKASHRTRTASSFRRISGKSPVVFSSHIFRITHLVCTKYLHTGTSYLVLQRVEAFFGCLLRASGALFRCWFCERVKRVSSVCCEGRAFSSVYLQKGESVFECWRERRMLFRCLFERVKILSTCLRASDVLRGARFVLNQERKCFQVFASLRCFQVFTFTTVKALDQVTNVFKSFCSKDDFFFFKRFIASKTFLRCLFTRG